MVFRHKNDIVGVFAQHKVAANLLMVILLLAGLWAVFRLNTQFFPNFARDLVNIRVVWTGASAEDVERSITNPLEQELRNLDDLKKITSTSANGVSSVTLEYVEGTDMGTALDQVKEKVGLVRELPTTSEEPEVTLVVRYEPIARVLVTGPRISGSSVLSSAAWSASCWTGASPRSTSQACPRKKSPSRSR